MTITTDELLARNREYVESQLHKPMPTVSDMMSQNLDPAHVVIPLLTMSSSKVTCADPRATPEYYFQLNPGEVIILRNVGGQAVHSLNDLLVLDSFVHVSDIIIVHHSDCGATHVSETKVRDDLTVRLPDRSREISNLQFGEITNLEKSVSDDIAFLKASPFIRPELHSRIRGFLYDIKTGKLREIA